MTRSRSRKLQRFFVAGLAAVGVSSSARAQTATCPTPIEANSPTKDQPLIAPIEISNNHVFVKVCAGDTPLDFILDTGAGATYFDLTHAKQLGLTVGSAFTVGGAGAGTVAGGRIDGASVSLVGTGIGQRVSSALDLSNILPREGHRMDGILGYDFISRFVVGIDYVKQELRLYDADSFQYSGPGTSVPVTFFNDHPHINTEVRLADGTTIPARMIVDVGSAASVSLTKPLVDQYHLRDRVGPTVRRRGGGGVGGATWSDMGRIASLRIGNLQIMNPTTTLYGDSAGVFSSPGTWVGNIGGEVLRRFTVFLDYKHNRMIFEPHSGTSDAFEADMSGIGFVMDGSLQTLIVDTVVPDSPASTAGITPRDTITAIDGRPATALEYRELRKRLRRVGEHVSFTIRRAGETKTIAIVTRRLV